MTLELERRIANLERQLAQLSAARTIAPPEVYSVVTAKKTGETYPENLDARVFDAILVRVNFADPDSGGNTSVPSGDWYYPPSVNISHATNDEAWPRWVQVVTTDYAIEGTRLFCWRADPSSRLLYAFPLPAKSLAYKVTGTIQYYIADPSLPANTFQVELDGDTVLPVAHGIFQNLSPFTVSNDKLIIGQVPVYFRIRVVAWMISLSGSAATLSWQYRNSSLDPWSNYPSVGCYFKPPTVSIPPNTYGTSGRATVSDIFASQCQISGTEYRLLYQRDGTDSTLDKVVIEIEIPEIVHHGVQA